MKISRKTRNRIIKIVSFARSTFLAMFGIFILLCAASADSINLAFPITFFVIAMACFGISYFCDYLLGGHDSPFCH